MSNKTKTVLEWSYEPEDFFEAPVTLDFEGGVINVFDGVARGEFGEEYYEAGKEFFDKANGMLDSAFLAQQAQIHLPYTLSSTTFCRESADGHRDVTVFASPITMTIRMGSPDIVVRDASGKVVQDSKAERLEKQRLFRESVLKRITYDLTLKRMLQSMRNANQDRDNLFIHLYEVRDALGAEIGSSNKVRAAVGVSKSEWDRFNKMANDEPLFEGRHRGKRTNLRAATPDEIKWARDFCQRMIEGYLTFKQRP